MKGRLLFSIKTKFILTSTLIVALSSATWGCWFWYKESKQVLKRVETEGHLLLSSMQVPILDALLYERIGVVEENVGLLDNFVEQIVGNEELRVVYAFITDNNGKAVSHSNILAYGRVYRDPLTVAVLSGHGFIGEKTVGTGDAPIFDMAMPLGVAGKTWGVLRVGVSMAGFEAELRELKREILIFSGLFFLIGNLVFYVVGRAMSKPLKELSAAMVGINYESIDTLPPPRPRNDEIGQLQNSYYEMLSRLKKAEQERQKAVAQLVQNAKLATMGRIVAGVAHEINNPLMVMSTSLFQLERKAPQDLGRYLEVHKEGMQRIEGIVRQLTDFSRVRSLELQSVASGAFFKETAAFSAMALKKRDVRFVSRDLAAGTTLFIDKAKLHQVVLNLLLNAATASPADAVVELTAYLEKDSYCLSVRDQGAGIAPEQGEKIFEIFYTTRPGGGGSGIGLAISKSIVEMHNGEINFDSRPGETTFVIRIPLQGEA